jgi:hypothetical protein
MSPTKWENSCFVRSIEFSPSGYFLRKYSKSEVCEILPGPIAKLKQNIRKKCENVDGESKECRWEETTLRGTHRDGNHSNNNILKREQFVYIVIKYSSFLQKWVHFVFFDLHLFRNRQDAFPNLVCGRETQLRSAL